MIDLFGDEVKKEEIQEEPQQIKIGAFDVVDTIYKKTGSIIDKETVALYNPYLVNKALSMGKELIYYANEMNIKNHLDKDMQYNFYYTAIRKGKRYYKWVSGDSINNVDIIKQYYGYNTTKAISVLRILTPEQVEYIKKKMSRGGVQETKKRKTKT